MNDDLNLVKGTHQVSIGFNIAHWRTNQYAATRAVGQYSFSGQATGLGSGGLSNGPVDNSRTRNRYVVGEP